MRKANASEKPTVCRGLYVADLINPYNDPM